MAVVPATPVGSQAADPVAAATGPSDAAARADAHCLRVVYGQPTAEELAAVVAVLLLAARGPRGAAQVAARDEPAEPTWLRGPYSAPTAWTAGP